MDIRLRLPKRTRLLGLAIVLASLLGGPSALTGQRLSIDERQMALYLDAHTEQAIALLEEVVNINSGTMNHGGVRAVGAVFSKELESLGFEVGWVDFPPEVNRAGHLVARRPGDATGPKILMIGHLDTVFEKDSPFQTFERNGNIASGPGVTDMKSGDVAILYALKALAHAGVLDDLSIVVALTGEEESPGMPLTVSRAPLIDAGKWADLALGFEGGSRREGKEYATVARRSSTDWTLEVEGKTGHSSRIFGEEYGAGAIFEAARILNRFYEEVRGEEYLTFNAGAFLGGTDVAYDPEQTSGTVFGKTNVIPQKVVVHGGIRTISQEQLERARSKMREIVERSLPGTNATISFFEGYPPMTPREGNYVLLEKLSRVSQDLGYRPLEALDPGLRGAADISFVAPYTDGLSGMGAYGSGAHSPEETVDLQSMIVAAKRAAVLMYRLSREQGGDLP